MTSVMGLDISAAKSGIALPDGTTRTVLTTAGPRDPWRRLHELETGVTRAVRAHPPVATFAVIEGYALGSPGRLSLCRSAEAGGVVRNALYALGVVASIEVSPSALKRYATGSGGADKDAMMRAARAEGAVLSHGKADDEADAYLLRHLGRALLGLDPWPTEAERKAVLEKLADDNAAVIRPFTRIDRPAGRPIAGASTQHDD